MKTAAPPTRVRDRIFVTPLQALQASTLRSEAFRALRYVTKIRSVLV